MKIGIISDHREGPVAKAIEQVYKVLTGSEIERLSMAEFQLKYVPEKSLDALIIEGRNVSDEGFAIAVRRNVPEATKVCYYRLYTFYNKPGSPQELQQQNINVIDIFDADKEKLTKWLGGS